MEKYYRIINHRTSGLTVGDIDSIIIYVRDYTYEKITGSFVTGPRKGSTNWWFYLSDLEELSVLNRVKKEKKYRPVRFNFPDVIDF